MAALSPKQNAVESDPIVTLGEASVSGDNSSAHLTPAHVGQDPSLASLLNPANDGSFRYPSDLRHLLGVAPPIAQIFLCDGLQKCIC